MSTELKTTTNHRVIYYDLLRILATLGVVILHTAGSKWANTEISSFQWQTFNFFDGIVRWSVPIFVMISGSLFLKGNSSIEKIHKKNILRIVTAFLFWSFLYAGVSVIQGRDFNYAVADFLKGHYHMWFLYMIIGLYLIVPFVKKIVVSPKLTNYFLKLSLIFTFIFHQLIGIVSLFPGSAGEVLSKINENANFYFTYGFVAYFILGYYISNKDLSEKSRKTIYILSAIGFLTTVVLTAITSLIKKEPQKLFFDSFSVNVLLESLGLFVFFKYKVDKISFSDKAVKIISKLSKYSFGVYLVHAMILEQLNVLFGLNTLSFNPIFSVVLIVLIVFIVSYVISFILNHIPVINKYIV